MPTDLPESFDLDFYKGRYGDIRDFSNLEAKSHYLEYGLLEGRVACEAQLRENLLHLLSTQLTTLEIGLFTTPALRGGHVAYFDVLDTEALK